MKNISLETVEENEQGLPESKVKTYQVKIPPGITDNKTIRLSGQGGKSRAGGTAGDLLLRVKIAEHPRYRLKGSNLYTTLVLTPWEAALGAKVTVPTLDGPVVVKIPAGSQSGQRLRLKGKGLPMRKDQQGDLFAELAVSVPKVLSPEERELFEKLAQVSTFNPRS